jgi:hypothetical protein
MKKKKPIPKGFVKVLKYYRNIGLKTCCMLSTANSM